MSNRPFFVFNQLFLCGWNNISKTNIDLKFDRLKSIYDTLFDLYYYFSFYFT